MGKIYLGISFIAILFAEDEFFTPGYSIGGYGELHYNRSNTLNQASVFHQAQFLL